MNMTKKMLLATSLFGIIAVTACTSVNEAPAPAPKAEVPAVQSTQTATMEIKPQEKLLSCDNLKTAESKEFCLRQTSDLVNSMLSREILESFDAARCGELSEFQAKNCQETITATGVKGPVSAAEVAIYNQALAEIKLDQCAELKTAGYKEYCQKNIQERLLAQKFNSVISEGKLSRCSELAENTQLQEQCQLLLAERTQ